jgi:hypothetical protein
LKKALLVTLAAMALAAPIVGCGSGDDSTTEETSTLSKAEFIERGDAICRKANEKIEKESEKFAEEHNFTIKNGHVPNDQMEEAFVAVLAPELKQQAKELSELEAPDGDEEQVEEIIDSLEGVAGEIEDQPSIALGDGVLQEPDALAEDYGFKVCGDE